MRTSSFQTKLLSVNEPLGLVDALANVTGIIDSVDDVTVLGCFSRTIREKGPSRILVLDGHDSSSPGSVVAKCIGLKEIGRSELPPAILSEFPSATGALWTRSQFFLDSPKSATIFKAIAGSSSTAGGISWSIGYQPIKFDFGTLDGQRVRFLRDVDLMEYSPVTFAANDASRTLAVKCLRCARPGSCGKCANDERRRFERFYDDELRNLIEQENIGPLLRAAPNPVWAVKGLATVRAKR